VPGAGKPHYTCEHCGAEVGRNDKICRACGHFFTSVKCPRCGYSGAVKDFDSGCPVCGYAERMNAESDPVSASNLPVHERAQPTPLPMWVYLIVGLVAVFTLFLLLKALR
jgi:predicted RNA-binding Zn-ribbon protein involved in translation (DUF1610 family)